MELQRQESKLPVTSEEQKFELSRQELAISKQPEETLREVLRYAMVKIGLRAANFPDGAEKALLIAHIMENYGNHTPTEIRLAFDLALSAKLGLDVADVKCYESFSCAYFSGIMNAYRVWSAQVSVQKEKETPPAPKVYTQDELDQIDREYEAFLKTPLAKKLGKL